MLRRVRDLYGCTVRASDGDAGKVHDLYFDDQDWGVRYLVVDTGWWVFSRRVLISPVALRSPRWERQVVPVALSREDVRNSPVIDVHKPVSQQQLLELQCRRLASWPRSPLLGTGIVDVYPMLSAGPEAGEDETASGDGATEKGRHDPHLRSTREVIGYHIQAKDGEIGHVEDFLVSERDWLIRYVLVDTRNWLPGREVVVGPQWVEEVDCPGCKVCVRLARGGVEAIPEYMPDDN